MPSPEFDFIQQKIKDQLAFRAKYQGGPMRRLLPYALGWSPDPSDQPVEFVLCYDFTNPPKAGWRCFKVAGLTDLKDNGAPLPSPLPVCDCDRQNCVTEIEEQRC